MFDKQEADMRRWDVSDVKDACAIRVDHLTRSLVYCSDHVPVSVEATLQMVCCAISLSLCPLHSPPAKRVTVL